MHAPDEPIEAHYNYKSLLSLPIEEIKSIQPAHLYCDNNYLIELPPDLPDSITHLVCSRNHITKLPDKLPSKLERLDCSHNNIYYLPDNLPKSVITLEIDWCPLKALPTDFSKYTNLKSLNLCKTLVAELPDLPESLIRITFYPGDPIFKTINDEYFNISETWGQVLLNKSHIVKINDINSRQRTQTRARLIDNDLKEHYARRTMHPRNLAPLLNNPDADVSTFLDTYINGL